MGPVEFEEFLEQALAFDPKAERWVYTRDGWWHFDGKAWQYIGEPDRWL